MKIVFQYFTPFWALRVSFLCQRNFATFSEQLFHRFGVQSRKRGFRVSRACSLFIFWYWEYDSCFLYVFERGADGLFAIFLMVLTRHGISNVSLVQCLAHNTRSFLEPFPTSWRNCLKLISGLLERCAHTIQTSKLDDYEVVVSLDIVSLFTKVLLYESIKLHSGPLIHHSPCSCGDWQVYLQGTSRKGFKGRNFANTSRVLQTDWWWCRNAKFSAFATC